MYIQLHTHTFIYTHILVPIIHYIHTYIHKHNLYYIIATTIGWPRSGQADSLIVRPLGSSRGGRHPGWRRRRVGPALCRHGKVTGTFHSLTHSHTYIHISAYALYIHTYTFIHAVSDWIFYFSFLSLNEHLVVLRWLKLHFTIAIKASTETISCLSVQTESVCMCVCMYVCVSSSVKTITTNVSSLRYLTTTKIRAELPCLKRIEYQRWYAHTYILTPISTHLRITYPNLTFPCLTIYTQRTIRFSLWV